MSAAPQEVFALNWRGKSASLALADTPLKANPKALSRKRDDLSSPNLLIEADNLDALKHLVAGYAGRVKLIVIDPPYNTGASLLYADNFGTYADPHSEWLSMMAPRLILAQKLLAPEGAIFVHIDENAQAPLDLLMAEVFGPQNRLGTLIWDKRNPKGDARGVAQQHEYIIGWAKDLAVFHQKVDFRHPKANAEAMIAKAAALWAESRQTAAKSYRDWLSDQDFSTGDKAYRYLDENGQVYRKVSMAWPNRKAASESYFTPLIHPTTGLACPVPAKGWRNGPDRMAELLASGQILFGKDESIQPTRKYLLSENLHEKVASVIYHGGSDDALLAQMGINFDNPKPIALLKRLIASCCKGDDLVLDFFAGSGSTPHAVMELNAQTGSALRWIAVQKPEPLARKGDFATIAELCAARIRRAGQKLQSPHFRHIALVQRKSRSAKSGKSAK